MEVHMRSRNALRGLSRKLGLGGAGAALVVVGALLVGGSVNAAPSTPAPSQAKSGAQSRVTGGWVAVAPGANGLASIQCPAGTVVTGGGGQTSAFRIFFTDSYRSGNGWIVRGGNLGSASEQIRAVAVCQRANSTL
jgi:hypothetical protein